MVKSRPILFSGAMVRALLAGTKTQTRRTVKVRGLDFIAGAASDRNDPCNFGYEADDGEWYTLRAQPRDASRAIPCRYGEPGDHLWVRESIRHIGDGGSEYVADGAWTKGDAWPWKNDTLPSIHCPRGLSRLTLEITDVRVQRLQEIHDEDSFQEGVDPCRHDGYHTDQGRCSFRTLWESINGPGSWDANPFVWALTFRRVAP